MPHPSSQTGAVSKRSKFNVLLVDDEKLVRFTLVAFFRNSEFAVTAVANAQEAIEHFCHETYDAVISDVMMEPVDGFALRSMLRNYNKEVPIIFLTSLVNGIDNSLLSKIMLDSFSYYVPKNFDRLFLLGKLKQVIQYYQAQKRVRILEHQIQRNQELASIVQQSLLPPWVHFEKNYEFSCLYRPLGQISGDLFDWIPINDHCCLSVFGDISGHGTHSALGMTAVQSYLTQLSTYGVEKASHPHLILREVNDFILRHLHNAVYMCGLFVFWDFENNIIRFHNAGYMDIIAIDSETGETLNLNPQKKGSVPMGMVEQTTYSPHDTVEYHFKDSTIFMISSDGLWDLSKDPDGESSLDNEELMELLGILVQQSIQEDNTISMPYLCYESLEQLGYQYPQDDCLLFMLRKPLKAQAEKICVYRLQPNNVDIDQVAQQAADFVLDRCGSEILAEKAELTIEEHLVNIVEHGLDEHDKENDYLVLKISVIGKNLKITIWDRGKEWLDESAITRTEAESILDMRNEEVSGSGRGLSIIKKIVSTISRQRHCGLNETVFFIPIEEGSKMEEDAS